MLPSRVTPAILGPCPDASYGMGLRKKLMEKNPPPPPPSVSPSPYFCPPPFSRVPPRFPARSIPPLPFLLPFFPFSLLLFPPPPFFPRPASSRPPRGNHPGACPVLGVFPVCLSLTRP